MIPDRDELKTLLDDRQAPCISLFLPTERSSPGKAPKTLKSLLRELNETLVKRGWSPARAEKIANAARPLVDRPEEWAREGDGAAIFICDEKTHVYGVPYSLNSEFVIAQRPFVLPLLPLLSTEGPFYLLAFSLHKVRLFEGHRDRIREIEIADVPQSLLEAVGHEYEDKSLQMRTGVTGGQGTGMMVHGHGEGSDSEKKREATVFLKRVDAGISSLLTWPDAPLVLAAVDYLQAIFREVSDHPNLVREGVSGNPDQLDARELHAKAWPLAEKVFLRQVDDAKEKARELTGTEKATDDLGQVLSASEAGRIDRLLVARGARAWGTFDRAERVVSPDDGTAEESDELLNRATAQCLGTGGMAFLVDRGELPDGSPVAAVLRY